MSLSVSVNLEAYPQEQEIGIVGIGVFKNGGDSIEITPQKEESYFYQFGKTIEENLGTQEGVTVTGSSEWSVPKDFEISNTSENATPPTEEVVSVPKENEHEQLTTDQGLPTGLPQGGDN